MPREWSPLVLPTPTRRLARGLVRRVGVAGTRAGNRLRVGDLALDEDAREVHRDGELIELTGTEFELLQYLMRNPRRVLSRDQTWITCGSTTSVVTPT